MRALMSLYEGAKTRVRVGLELSKEFEVKVGMHQGFTLSPLVFAIVVEMRKREKFWKWKVSFESKGLKVNLGKTKVVVSGAESEKSLSKVDPCGICGKRVMVNSVLCVKCGKWIHGRCAKVL